MKSPTKVLGWLVSTKVLRVFTAKLGSDWTVGGAGDE